ncbi:MFS transporter [Deinococcus petrolearius]|uniref:MFS transporter n=1 Tax=Deinococcus petrolearius TaxID=1751295 RepID=A0ABW1DKT5_9DEIO
MSQPVTAFPPSAAPGAERARLAVSAVFLINGALFATWAVNIPGVRDGLGLSQGQIGAALLAFGLGSLTTMPFTGGWTARWGSGRVTAVTGVLTMLSLALPFFMPSLLALALSLALLGALNGCLDVAMNAQGVSVEKRLGRPIISRLHAYFSLGGVVGALLGTALLGRVPMLTHVLAVVALTALTALVAARHLLPDAAGRADTAGEAQAPGTAPSAAAPSALGTATLLLGGLCALGMFAEGANYDWAALYFRDVLGVTGTGWANSGWGYAAFVTAMTLGRWFGDRLRARLGEELIVRGGSLLTAAGMALVLLARDPVPAALGFALAGLGLSNVVPVMYGVAGHALAGRGIARVATIGYAGFLLGPPAIGFAADHWGLRAALLLALLGAALVAVLGAPTFGLLRRRSA